MKQRSLPLVYRTPKLWGAAVLTDPVRLLNDHAHLERKAATNALELMSGWSAGYEWLKVLAGIARDETNHLARVLRLLHERGGEMSLGHKNPYAQSLRALIRRGTGPAELVDKLCISALIELRSCERFSILAEVAPTVPAVSDLTRLYTALAASEHGHYRVFLRLAYLVRPIQPVQERWELLRKRESEIIAGLPKGIGMHSGA